MTLNFNMSVPNIEARFKQNIPKAQYALDTQIFSDMYPLMPYVTNSFRNVTQARSQALAGSGLVCAGYGPQAGYLYYGVKMVDSVTGKGPRRIPVDGGYIFRYKKGAKLVPTAEPLKYSSPEAMPQWAEVAQQRNIKQWMELVGRELTK